MAARLPQLRFAVPVSQWPPPPQRGPLTFEPGDPCFPTEDDRCLTSECMPGCIEQPGAPGYSSVG
jgi:hypothetical protein